MPAPPLVAPPADPNLALGPAPSLVEGPAPSFVEGPAPSFIEGPLPGGGVGGTGSPAAPQAGSDLPVATPVAGGGIGGTGAPMPPAADPGTPPAPPGPAPAGTQGGAGSVTGVLTGFGSIFVNGIEFDTSGAAVVIEDTPAADVDLRVGMVLTVQGIVNPDGATGVASRIEFADDLEGPIDRIDLAAGSLTVLGQTVRWDAFTAFGVPGPDVLRTGEIVQVSGRRAADGSLRASRIDRTHPVFVPGVTPLELRGAVEGTDAVSATFRIGAQAVYYGGALLVNLPQGLPADGLTVEVTSAAGVSGGRLLADRVEAADGAAAVDSGWTVLRGFITALTSPTDFQLDGRPVRVAAATEFLGGSAADLAANAEVNVEGAWEGDILAARRVTFLQRGSVVLEGEAEDVDSALGALRVMRQAVRVSPFTLFKDTHRENAYPFRLSDVRVRDRVKVLAHPSADGVLTAELVERARPAPTLVLQGLVESVANPRLVILGIAVDTAAGVTRHKDRQDDGAALVLFDTVATGNVVRAEGRWLSHNVFFAESVEIVK